MWGHKWNNRNRYTVIASKEEIEMINFAFSTAFIEGQTDESMDRLDALFRRLLKDDSIPAPDQDGGDPHLT